MIRDIPFEILKGAEWKKKMEGGPREKKWGGGGSVRKNGSDQKRAVMHGLTDGSFLGWQCVMLITYLIKADRPHPRYYQQTPTDYRHTDNHLRLVMVLVVAHCCTRQSWELWQINTQTNKHMDGQTDGRYQVHYLAASRSMNIPFVGPLSGSQME